MPELEVVEKRSGKLKWFDADKGYGFIAVRGEDDVFVHATDLKKSGIRDTLTEGDELNFELVPGRNGVKAANLTRVTRGGFIPAVPASIAAGVSTVIHAQPGDA